LICEELEGSATMENVTTVGLDLAKNVFQVHGVDVEGTAAPAHASTATMHGGKVETNART
jgi:hypothetical protein